MERCGPPLRCVYFSRATWRGRTSALAAPSAPPPLSRPPRVLPYCLTLSAAASGASHRPTAAAAAVAASPPPHAWLPRRALVRCQPLARPGCHRLGGAFPHTRDGATPALPCPAHRVCVPRCGGGHLRRGGVAAGRRCRGGVCGVREGPGGGRAAWPVPAPHCTPRRAAVALGGPRQAGRPRLSRAATEGGRWRRVVVVVVAVGRGRRRRWGGGGVHALAAAADTLPPSRPAAAMRG